MVFAELVELKDATGKFTINAEVIDIVLGKVVLKDDKDKPHNLSPDEFDLESLKTIREVLEQRKMLKEPALKLKFLDLSIKIKQSNPKQASDYVTRGNYFWTSFGNRQSAIKDYTEAIKLEPQSAKYQSLRGRAYAEQKQFQEARQDHNKAIMLQPAIAEFHYSKACCEDRAKQYMVAIAGFTKAIQLDPLNSDAFYGRGDAHRMSKNYELALNDYNKAMELKKGNCKASLTGLAYLFLNEGNEVEAIIRCANAIVLDKEYGPAYYARGMAYKQQGKIQKANADFQKAKQLGYTPD